MSNAHAQTARAITSPWLADVIGQPMPQVVADPGRINDEITAALEDAAKAERELVTADVIMAMWIDGAYDLTCEKETLADSITDAAGLEFTPGVLAILKERSFREPKCAAALRAEGKTDA